MSLKNLTEQEFAALVKRLDRDPIERARSSANCTQRDSSHVGDTGVTAVPKAKLSGSSPYKSKWEAAYASKLELEKRAGLIQAWRYEGMTFTLSKGQYHRPDFIVWHLDGSIEIAQVKGWHKNMRAGTKGLKWAAQLNPWFTWTVKRWTGTGWDGEYVT